ncbi:MAG TPA: hypothetical protein VL738_12700 [Dactylosporangium sp.]|jgi:hypothetical protein|nr:hypothetical protein [Dactylosporangium sp.]
MPDTIVEDEFARFAEEFTGTFRPVPVEAMPRWRRARRRGAVWLGGLATALVAALSVNALQPAAPAPANLVTQRTVRLEGARGTMGLQFVDARHGWVIFSDCRADNRCDITLGRSTDGGRHWTRIEPPELPEVGRMLLVPTGKDSAFVGIGSDRYPDDPMPLWWETTDGGRSFQASTASAADYYVRKLYLPGPQPSGEVITLGNDQEEWKTRYDGLVTRVYYSPGGQDWRELPAELPASGMPKVSHDGRDVWVLTEMPNRAWRLTSRDAVEMPGFPASAAIGPAQPVGNGGLVVTVPGEGTGVWRDGRFTPFAAPMVRAQMSILLDDGTLALSMQGEGLILGTEGGPWVWYRPPAT